LYARRAMSPRNEERQPPRGQRVDLVLGHRMARIAILRPNRTGRVIS
jgi:hypothetical protein